MKSKTKLIVRELGRINIRSSFFYNMDNDEELLDKIAALIAEHHLQNPRVLTYKELKRKRRERRTKEDLELALYIHDKTSPTILTPSQLKNRKAYLKRKERLEKLKNNEN